MTLHDKFLVGWNLAIDGFIGSLGIPTTPGYQALWFFGLTALAAVGWILGSLLIKFLGRFFIFGWLFCMIGDLFRRISVLAQLAAVTPFLVGVFIGAFHMLGDHTPKDPTPPPVINYTFTDK